MRALLRLSRRLLFREDAPGRAAPALRGVLRTAVVVKTPAMTPTTTISTASMPQIAFPKALTVPMRLKRPVVGIFIFFA